MKKTRRLSTILLAFIMIFAMQSTAFASTSDHADEGITPLDWTGGYNVYLTAQTANMQKFGQMKSTTNDHFFTVTFKSTEGPTSVRVYLYDQTTSTKLAEKTLLLGESISASVPIGDTFFASVMWVSGTSGYVTLQLTWS